MAIFRKTRFGNGVLYASAPCGPTLYALTDTPSATAPSERWSLTVGDRSEGTSALGSNDALYFMLDTGTSATVTALSW